MSRGWGGALQGRSRGGGFEGGEGRGGGCECGKAGLRLSRRLGGLFSAIRLGKRDTRVSNGTEQGDF